VQQVFLAFHILRSHGDFAAIHELFRLCSQPDYRIFGNSGQKLFSLGLLLDLGPAGRGVVHEAIRDVVLAAITEISDQQLQIAERPEDIIQ
jgi:hypothetical protein